MTPFDPGEYPDLHLSIQPFVTSVTCRTDAAGQLEQLILDKQADVLFKAACAFDEEGDAALCCSAVAEALRMMASIIRSLEPGNDT